MLKTKLIATAAALALAASASAVTQTVNTTLDLTLAGLAPSGFTGTSTGFSAFPGFALAIGDTLDYTIDFSGGQSLVLTNPGLIWAFIYSGDPQLGVTGTGSLELLGPTGNVLFASNTKTDTEFFVHFGQQFGPSDFASLPTTLQFWGLHYVGSVDGYDDGITTSRDYQQPSLTLFADGIKAVVPEPASWALMIGGFGLVGATLRRQRLVAA